MNRHPVRLPDIVTAHLLYADDIGKATEAKTCEAVEDRCSQVIASDAVSETYGPALIRAAYRVTADS